MNTQQLQTLAQQFIDALHTLERGGEHEVEQIVGMYGDDARLTNAALKLAGKEHQGKHDIRQFWIEYRRTFGDVYSDFFKITTGDQAVGLFWTTKGTDTNGQPIEYDGVSLLLFDDQGKIIQFRGYYDTREISRTVSNG